MGLDYSFEVATERSQVDVLLQAIAAYLIPEDRDRLLRAVPFRPEIGLAEVPMEDWEHQSPCLHFLFPLDETLRRYAADKGLVSITDPYCIGCVYGDLKIGRCWVGFTATAATTNMSLLFAESESIRGVWRSIGEAAGARLVLFDLEGDEYEAIWPVSRHFCCLGRADTSEDFRFNPGTDDHEEIYDALVAALCTFP